MKRTAPFITPFAIFSAVLALGATNVVVNTATHTVEGKPKTEVVEKTTPSQEIDFSKPAGEKTEVVEKTTPSQKTTDQSTDKAKNSQQNDQNQDQTDNQKNQQKQNANNDNLKDQGGQTAQREKNDNQDNDTNAPWRRFNLHKTNAANEELVSRLKNGREAQGGFRYTDCSYHSNSLSNKMGNSLLDVRGINHKYIVVGGLHLYRRLCHAHISSIIPASKIHNPLRPADARSDSRGNTVHHYLRCI